MKSTRMTLAVAAAAMLALSACGPQGDSSAAEYPTGEIELLVGFPPGAQNDVVARHFARQMEEELDATILVVNREGGGGAIAAAEVSNSNPDGQTLFFAPTGAFTSGILLQDTQYEIDDFRSIVPVAESAFIVAAPAGSGIEEFEDLQNLGDGATYTSVGEGHAMHLVGAGVAEHFDVEAEVVVFSGGTETAQAIANGDVDFGIQDINSGLSRIESGDIIPLAVSTEYLPPALEELGFDVPSIAEFGLEDYVFAGSQALAVPADTPDDVVETLREAAQKVIESEEHRSFVKEHGGAVPDVGGEEWFSEFMPSELDQFEVLYDKHGIAQ